MWLFYFSVFALMSSQEHRSSRMAQANILFPGNREHIWYASLLLLVYFQGSDKSAEKKHQGKIRKFQSYFNTSAKGQTV